MTEGIITDRGDLLDGHYINFDIKVENFVLDTTTCRKMEYAINYATHCEFLPTEWNVNIIFVAYHRKVNITLKLSERSIKIAKLVASVHLTKCNASGWNFRKIKDKLTLEYKTGARHFRSHLADVISNDQESGVVQYPRITLGISLQIHGCHTRIDECFAVPVADSLGRKKIIMDTM